MDNKSGDKVARQSTICWTVSAVTSSDVMLMLPAAPILLNIKFVSFFCEISDIYNL